VIAAEISLKINQDDYHTENANIITGKKDCTDLHNILGHANKKVIKNTAKLLKVEIPGLHDDIKCPDCSLAKSRIRNFCTSTDPTTEQGEKVSFDISCAKILFIVARQLCRLFMELFLNSQKGTM
jgi:hypothetical protein